MKTYKWLRRGFIVMLAMALIPLFRTQYLAAEQCPDQVPASDTVSTLEHCMVSLQNETDVYNTLVRWHRAAADHQSWGDVRDIQMLPGASKERLVIFYPDLTQMNWNQQGKLVIFQQQAQGWRAIYDAASIQFDDGPGKGWTNWSYQVKAINDTAADGLDDVLIKIEYSNGHNGTVNYAAILTGRGQNQPTIIHVAFLEETTHTVAQYKFGNNSLSTERFVGRMGHIVDHRIFTYNRIRYALVSESIDPPSEAIQLLKDMTSHPTDHLVFGTALNAIGPWQGDNEWGIIGPLDYPSESLLLQVAKLKLTQLSLLANQVTLWPVPIWQQTLQMFAEYPTGQYTGFWSTLSAAFTSKWQATHSLDKSCQVMADLADQNPAQSLDLIRQASGGVLNYTGRDLCMLTILEF
jgi:hypothetical protein